MDAIQPIDQTGVLLAAIDDQLSDVEAELGRLTRNWRDAAADPNAARAVVEARAGLEAQRTALREAKAQGEAEIAGRQSTAKAQRVCARIAAARVDVEAALDVRGALAARLSEAVDQVAATVLELHQQGVDLARLFAGTAEASKVTGIDMLHVLRMVNQEDVRSLVDQVLGCKLGGQHWPTETSAASRRLRVAAPFERECMLVRSAFERGAGDRAMSLQVPE